MARSHTYPVSKNSFEKVEWDNNPLDLQIENRQYISGNRRIINYVTSDPSVIRSVSVTLSEGETLIDLPDTSFDGGTLQSSSFLTLQLGLEESFGTDSLAINPLKEGRDYGKLEAGQIACIAVKRLDEVFDNDGRIYNQAFNHLFGGVSGDDGFGFNYPFGRLGGFHGYAQYINEGKWVTLMFTGTRWVVMGSNNWY